MLFKIVHGAQCVLKVQGGVYKQVDVYTYGGRLFAKNDGGFIALRSGSMTSTPNITWEQIVGVDFVIGTGSEWGTLLAKVAA
jgi:hypothetical protein